MIKGFSPILIVLFGLNMLLSPVSYAQVAFLPPVGSMVNLTPKYNPLLVKGVKLFPDNPFKFEFIVDTGDENLTQDQIKVEGQKLSSFFLAALTTPEKEMWVNLSPYEKGRIIPKDFGDTEMGKEILAQDYVLKQIMATALYPEKELGREFWNKVYSEAASKFGTTNVPINTFNKVWIVPNEAVIYENAAMNTVFVVNSSLKVMMERDYLAANKQKAAEQFGMGSTPSQDLKATGDLSAKIIKELVIPALEKEVNEGKNFAKLRQVYQTLILAAWYKKNLKDSILSKGYVDQGKTLGIDTKDKQITQKIYQQYLLAYKKGAYNYIKEELDPATNQVIPRKYFSGGVAVMSLSKAMTTASPAMAANFNMAMSTSATNGSLVGVSVDVFMNTGDENYKLKPEDFKGVDPFQDAMQILSNMFKEVGVSREIDVTDVTDLPSAVNKINNSPVVYFLYTDKVRLNVDPNISAIASSFLETHKVNSFREVSQENLIALARSSKGQQLKRAILEVRYPDLMPRKPQKPEIRQYIQQLVSMFSVADVWDLIKHLVTILPPPNQDRINKAARELSIGSARGFAFTVALAVMPMMASTYSSNNPANNTTGLTGITSFIPGNPNTNPNLNSDPSQVGGIDLEKVNIMIKEGSSKIKTAFNDPRVLNLLLQAQGLFPEVQSIKPVNAPMVNMYLGFNTNNNEPLRSADKANQDIPKSAWLNKPGVSATL